MQKLTLTTLSLFIVACTEQAPQDNTAVSDTPQTEQQAEFYFGMDKVPGVEKNSFERSEDPFHNYLADKIEELQTQEAITLENLQPTEVPVDGNCVYGGELDGNIDITLDTGSFDIDLFDDNDLQLESIEGIVQPMANGQDSSPQHNIIDSVLELTLHKEYVDVQTEADVDGQGKLNQELFDTNTPQLEGFGTLVYPMANGQDSSPQHNITDSVLELTLHKEYVDVQTEADVDGQGKLNQELFDTNTPQLEGFGTLVYPMANGQDSSPQHNITDSVLELTLHKEYVDVQIEADVDEQGKLNGEWFICTP